MRNLEKPKARLQSIEIASRSPERIQKQPRSSSEAPASPPHLPLLDSVRGSLTALRAEIKIEKVQGRKQEENKEKGKRRRILFFSIRLLLVPFSSSFHRSKKSTHLQARRRRERHVDCARSRARRQIGPERRPRKRGGRGPRLERHHRFGFEFFFLPPLAFFLFSLSSFSGGETGACALTERGESVR